MHNDPQVLLFDTLRVYFSHFEILHIIDYNIFQIGINFLFWPINIYEYYHYVIK